MNTLITAAKASLLASVLPQGVRASLAEAPAPETLHYRPLDGRNLRDIARFRLHHGKGRFLNPFGYERRGRLFKVLSWKLFHRNGYQAELDAQPVRPVALDWEAVNQKTGVSVTFLKHAGVLINDRGHRILIDPVFSEIFGFIRDFTPLAFDPRRLPGPDQLLLTHGHFDHLHLPTLATLPKEAQVLSPLGYGTLLSETGLHRRTELDWYESVTTREREITLLPCNHWTMRSPLAGPNLALWGSYLIRTAAGATIYVSGDTAYFDGFEQIGREFDIDLALINLGAYSPRWLMAQSHLDPAEAVRAFRELRAEKLAVLHWGTFRLGDEPVHLPPRHIREEMAREGLLSRLVDWNHGETVFL
jgi:N-acyl-phosphatidylethanolamine-hydrolysing phospholipase D